MIIGIFDPNLADTGHYLRLNKHLVKIFGYNNKIVFFDISNIFTKKYIKSSNWKDEKVTIVNLVDDQLPGSKD
ncbi:hypothetical protein AMJ49_06060, partial [Parcubacteria bacterium DG_74_2]